MTSIRRHMLLWLLGALSLGAMLLALASYTFTLEEMNEVFDNELKQVALTVLTHHADSQQSANQNNSQYPSEDFNFVTQVWTADGGRLFVSVNNTQIPFQRAEGLSTVATANGPWRVYTIRSNIGVIQAAQPLQARQALAVKIAFKLLLPSIFVVPLMAFLLAYALQRGLQPLTRATHEIGLKSSISLEPISTTDLPLEMHSLVNAINALMARLEAALSAQREFTADAAHELRTPLTALSLQLDLLQQADRTEGRKAALSDMRSGVGRATHLVEQLLWLSRLGPDAASQQVRAIDLALLARTAVAEFNTRAEIKKIDLGAEAQNPVLVQGDADQLRILLNNLVDNAIRYTPIGGQIDVWVGCDAQTQLPLLEVRDSGPGVPADEQVRIFDRFYRASSAQTADGIVPGTGLGLAIVKAIAERHHADIALAAGLANQQGGSGLAVRVKFAKMV
ncbi:MAG: ATP-binding protein [Burkholderiaceae bacterium]